MQTLVVTDRFTGEREVIHDHDGNFRQSIESAAEKNCVSYEAALAILRDGGTIHTAGFTRHFERRC